MAMTIEKLILVILACYGIYRLVQDVAGSIRRQPGPPVSMLVVLKNRAQDAEYLMRRMASWSRHQWVQLEIVVVDDGSQDDTPFILQGLQQQMALRLITIDRESPGMEEDQDRALLTGLLYCHNPLIWLVDLRKLPQRMMAERIFRVFFCQAWR
ncbi:glycosyltransferase family 2 protein [Desulforamulus ruminis]|uniref:Glycosyltransferase 2-like domain-containing protein n=1 Tax=Desulforamulus ruminis (strain ATCC 23193 / DSM 2154 / NCIMB 8452 / DL) TaxID=696281 RepID=F6DNE8_DESRL|nr:glycosyltransferase [Desulforamulus ruminis]AEG61839.1 hypothetical protein Desru_3637 [Desulforamulus ruminis DSM 2154]